MWLDLGRVINKLSHDPDVRVVVLGSSGDKAFTAGLDVQAAFAGPTLSGQGAHSDVARRANASRRHIYEFQDCITTLEKCEKPIITLYHGYALGLAIDIGVATDIRLAASNVKFSVKEVDIGIAADIGTLTRLPKVVGNFGWVKDVALSARIFGAEEAYRVGFVSELYPNKQALYDAGLEKAKLIASKSPVATMGTKHLLNYSRDRSVEDGLNYTAIWNAAMLQSEDVKSAALSGMQKRKPTFEKL